MIETKQYSIHLNCKGRRIRDFQ